MRELTGVLAEIVAGVRGGLDPQVMMAAINAGYCSVALVTHGQAGRSASSLLFERGCFCCQTRPS